MQHFVQTMQHIGNAINGFGLNSAFGKFLVCIGTMIVGFVAPIAGLLGICFATTIVDMICGIRVARKLGHKIRSSKGWKGTLRKILDEFTIILLAHGIETSIIGIDGFTMLTGGCTAIITLTELWSIIENLNTIDPSGPWRVLGKFLQKKGEAITGLSKEELINKYEHNSDITNAESERDNKVLEEA